jgi:uncharacterized membrane protein
MLRWAIAYAAAALTYLVLDSIWLGFAIPRLYRPAYGSLLADKFKAAPIIVFYAIYVSGILVLAVNPALSANSLKMALYLGATLGLVAYATYYLTNLGTIRGWPTSLTVIDLAWGTVSTSAAAVVAFWTATHFDSMK